MKLATYEIGNTTAIGAVLAGDRVLDLQAAARRIGADTGPFTSMLDLIDSGAPGLAAAHNLLAEFGNAAGPVRPIGEVRLTAPLPEPRQFRDFMAYGRHSRQAASGMQRLIHRTAGDDDAANAVEPRPDVAQVYLDRPIFYITNRFAVAGPDSIVRWPRYSSIMDFELELGMVLGTGGRDISAEDAADHIFGYTIFNDFSARDMQLREMAGMMGPAKGKSFDGSNVLGPWIVTRDEIPDVQSLGMTARVNGETWTAERSGDMLHSFEEMIAYVSQYETLRAGEVFGSGTVGNGCGLELGRFLNDGDEVELEVEGIGILRNRVSSH